MGDWPQGIAQVGCASVPQKKQLYKQQQATTEPKQSNTVVQGRLSSETVVGEMPAVPKVPTKQSPGAPVSTEKQGRTFVLIVGGMNNGKSETPEQTTYQFKRQVSQFQQIRPTHVKVMESRFPAFSGKRTQPKKEKKKPTSWWGRIKQSFTRSVNYVRNLVTNVKNYMDAADPKSELSKKTLREFQQFKKDNNITKKDRIVLIGHSAGGQQAATLASHSNDVHTVITVGTPFLTNYAHRDTRMVGIHSTDDRIHYLATRYASYFGVPVQRGLPNQDDNDQSITLSGIRHDEYDDSKEVLRTIQQLLEKPKPVASTAR